MGTRLNQRAFLRMSSLVAASFLVHLWALTASKLFPDAISFGDLSLYEYWAYQVENGTGVYGLATEWVYPAIAFVPIWIASALKLRSFLVGSGFCAKHGSCFVPGTSSNQREAIFWNVRQLGFFISTGAFRPRSRFKN